MAVERKKRLEAFDFVKSKYAHPGDYFVSKKDGRVFHIMFYKHNGVGEDKKMKFDLWVCVSDSNGDSLEDKFIEAKTFDMYVEKGILVKRV